MSSNVFLEKLQGAVDQFKKDFAEGKVKLEDPAKAEKKEEEPKGPKKEKG